MGFFVSCRRAAFECAVVTLLKRLGDICLQQFFAHGSVRTRHWFFSAVFLFRCCKKHFFMASANIISASSFLITFTHAAGHHWDLQSPLFSAISHFLIALAISQSRSPARSGGWEHPSVLPLRHSISNHRDSSLPVCHRWLIYLVWCQAFFKHRAAQGNLQFLYQLQISTVVTVLSHGSACFPSFWYVHCINILI